MRRVGLGASHNVPSPLVGGGQGGGKSQTSNIGIPPTPSPSPQGGGGPARAYSSGVRTTCPYCGVGCGVLARPDGGGATIAGDPEHPANFGRLCSKGSALGETLGLETRLLHPVVDGRRATWGEALDHLAARLAAVRAEHGAEAIAFYLSGQLLTEDYYVANKLAKGFIGTPHVDTNSRLCMASSVAGHRRAFGADVVPQCYEDVELADLVVLAGSNAAWCHPVLYQRIQAARAERGVRVVNIDPRRTATSEGADLQLSIRPGTDGVLWSGLLVALVDRRRIDAQLIAARTQGFDAALDAARSIAPTLAAVARATGLAIEDVAKFFDWFAATARVVSCYSQGVNQSAQGTDKVNAILNCHLATGRIGKPGSGPLSLTGQPNAMGGREVGGLANMLAAHMGFSEEERDRVRCFWEAPNLVTGPGLKAVDMFDAVADGRIKALWVMGTNPAASLPRADAVREALARLDLLVVSENVASNDTTGFAHARLPAAAWGEKDGTVTNSERRISRQRPFLPLAGAAQPDWWILSQVARRLGYGEAFAYASPAEVFDEHARLSGFENEGTRAFDISDAAGLSRQAYDALQPFQWPYRHAEQPTARLFADGGFFTPDGKARFVAIDPPRLAAAATEDWPFLLNTGRIRDQWHTMTRTGLSPRLCTHIAEPFVEIHPDDAARLGLEQGALAKVDTPHGTATLRVLVNRGQQPGTLFVPIHWSGENSSGARIGALVQAAADPHSGQPEAKATPARVAALPVAQYGFALSRQPLRLPCLVYWAAARAPFGHVLNFAFDGPGAGGWRRWLGSALPEGERVTFEDAGAGVFRVGVHRAGRIEALLFVGPSPKLPSPEWLKSQFDRADMTVTDRRALLAGIPFEGALDEGAIVCVCFQVGAARIAAAGAGCGSVESIGRQLGAGTNCGSCIPEIRRLIAGVKGDVRPSKSDIVTPTSVCGMVSDPEGLPP
jgi:assimilatory nitrate reductase catalytic subunit